MAQFTAVGVFFFFYRVSTADSEDLKELVPYYLSVFLLSHVCMAARTSLLELIAIQEPSRNRPEVCFGDNARKGTLNRTRQLLKTGVTALRYS